MIGPTRSTQTLSPSRLFFPDPNTTNLHTTDKNNLWVQDWALTTSSLGFITEGQQLHVVQFATSHEDNHDNRQEEN